MIYKNNTCLEQVVSDVLLQQNELSYQNQKIVITILTTNKFPNI